ncbi:MAG: gamma-glutamyl-gamma-aminobutyrate hydrolase family protein [Deltaproteobacteria bacterium]|nr:MAG: gamma-glutamyl-gamma-aminobutyrate hydrolase family protein [Deltaproteobacteria bacterium]
MTPDFEARPPGGRPHPRYLLKTAYAEAVLAAGGLPWILAYGDEAVVGAYLERIDALVVTGGAFDVPPELYGETPRPGLGPQKVQRTAFERALLEGALDRGLPVLGVCGGMQLLNVVRGGTLVQDLPREWEGALAHEQDTDPRRPCHEVHVDPRSRLAEMTGATSLEVNSTHHQAVARPGEGLLVSARAPDGVVEAIEDPARPFVLGVQWHPELLDDGRQQRIYQRLVAAAEARRQAHAS